MSDDLIDKLHDFYMKQSRAYAAMAKALVTETEAPKVKRKTKTQLPEDITLSEEWEEYCRVKRPDLDPQTVFENFKQFYISHGRAMMNWDMTFQRWVRNERKQAAPKQQALSWDINDLMEVAKQERVDPPRPGESIKDFRTRILSTIGGY